MNVCKQLMATGLVLALYSTPAARAQQSVSRFIDPANMNLDVKPGDDFYTYASGTWVKNNPVPEKEVRWGSFNILGDFNVNAIRTVLQKAMADQDAPAGSVTRRVGDFYAAGMDSITIEKRGYTPIKATLENIAAIAGKEALLSQMNTLRTTGYGAPLYGFFVGQDKKNVEVMIPQLSQGGISLPDRDYYLVENGRNKQITDAYKNYISTLFTLTGTPADVAGQHANTIFELEKKLAAAQLSRVEMRDAYKTYNKLHLDDLSKTTPGLHWRQVLAELKVKGQDSVIVNNPGFFKEVAGLLNTLPLQDWKTYLQWQVLKTAANSLSSAFVNASFEFNKILSGQKIQTPRWQRMSSLTDGSVGELLGQLYVKEYFKPEAKQRMEELVANMRKAFSKRINSLDWMGPETKQKAQAKLAAFNPKIGYPDQWKNYDGLEINRDLFFENVRNVSQWNYNYMISQLGKPVDRSRWSMTPPTVNAYYSATLNEIVFPAGILQFPFFDPNADDAINYGGIGAVIGHEMSHGFDDNGSKYDADGTLRNWWTEADRKRFEERTAKLVKQFDDYTVQDSIHVNGKLTLGENIGDLGGLNVAYEAFKMTDQGKSNKKIDGFTPDQRFFLSWAQVWRGNILPEAEAQRIIVDSHSPGKYRTIGTPVNMDAWYKAFDVKPGDKLYKKPGDRIKIW